MVTATRLVTNGTDGEIKASPGNGRPPKRADFKHAAAVFRSFEALAPAQAKAVAETESRIVDDVPALWQRERPVRSHPRVSRKPGGKASRKRKIVADG